MNDTVYSLYKIFFRQNIKPYAYLVANYISDNWIFYDIRWIDGRCNHYFDLRCDTKYGSIQHTHKVYNTQYDNYHDREFDEGWSEGYVNW